MGNYLKSGASEKKGLGEKEGVVFLKGGIDTLMYTMSNKGLLTFLEWEVGLYKFWEHITDLRLLQIFVFRVPYFLEYAWCIK